MFNNNLIIRSSTKTEAYKKRGGGGKVVQIFFDSLLWLAKAEDSSDGCSVDVANEQTRSCMARKPNKDHLR